MKIKEIVSEAYRGYVGHHSKEYGTVRKGEVDPAIPGARIEPQLRNTDTYMQMRYGVALAAAAANVPENEWEQESVWAENISMLGYTQEEISRIEAADKLMGVKSVEISRKGSQERSDVHTASPVASSSWRKSKK